MNFVVDIFVKGNKEILKMFDKALKGNNAYSFSNIVSIPEHVEDLKKWKQDNWGCFVDLNENETFEVHNNNGGEYIQYKFYSYLFGTPLRFVYECARKFPELKFKIIESAEEEIYSLVFENGRVVEEARIDEVSIISCIKYDRITGSKNSEYYRKSGGEVPELIEFIKLSEETYDTQLEKDLPF